MGVSKNSGTPKWMVYNGNPYKMDDLGVPLFSETPKYTIRGSYAIWYTSETPHLQFVKAWRNR